MSNTKGVKYPRLLAKNATSSKRQIEQLLPFDDIAEPEPEEIKKSMYNLSAVYDVTFDGLCVLCMDKFGQQWQDKSGEYQNYIDRADNPNETHFRSVLNIEDVKDVFCGPFPEYWPDVFESLKKLAYNPQKKKIILDKTHSIVTEPIGIDLIYDNGKSYKNLKNLAPRLSKKDAALGKKQKADKPPEKIIGMAFEYYKPFFLPIILLNKRKTAGKNYILLPRYFQLKARKTQKVMALYTASRLLENFKTLPEQEIPLIESFKDVYGFDPIALHASLQNHIKTMARRHFATILSVSPKDIRNLYLALADRDNHIGNFITIENLIEFVEGLWPDLVKENNVGEKKLYPSRYKEVIQRLNIIFFFYSVMVKNGFMDGGGIVPLKITALDNGEQFDIKANKLRIECLKNNSIYSKYTLGDFANRFKDLSQYYLENMPKKSIQEMLTDAGIDPHTKLPGLPNEN